MTDVVETARALVRIPSVNPGYDAASPGETAVSDWILQWASSQGIDAVEQEVFPGRKNVILKLRRGSSKRRLLLNGHTDTVAIEGMMIAPFGGDIRDGRLWGRGACDMKGPMACLLHTLIRLKDQASHWSGEVVLACVVDEELGFAGIRHYLGTDRTFDGAIVGEPTRLEVVRGCKGCLRFSLRAHGLAAHSSTPHAGVSAISAMAKAIQALDGYFANRLSTVRHSSLGTSTGSIGLIRGGTGINIVPDYCEIFVDIRLVPGQSWQETYAALHAVVEKTESPGIRWELASDPMVDPPFCLEESEPLVRTACQALGISAARVVNFSCDASKIATAGIPCLILGPGDIALAHTAEESIALEDLEQGVEAYTRVALAFLKIC